MPIAQRDIKLLWARSGALCAFPSCAAPDLLVHLADDEVVLGEMAHVIARRKGGPRSSGGQGSNAYENLVLLCPTHHTLVDKAPRSFPTDTLLEWKKQVEARIAEQTRGPQLRSRAELRAYLLPILAENAALHAAFGPDSPSARRNPHSEAATRWVAMKLGRLIPNNQKVAFALRGASALLTDSELNVAARFYAHASAFEDSAIERCVDVPRFPKDFETMVRGLHV